MSLHQYINKITIEFKYCHSNKVDSYSSYKPIYIKGDDQDYLNIFVNIADNNEYVTNELVGFNGIEDIKISIIIEFEISGSTFLIPNTFDDFIPVNED
ncbi:hypothetical protein [Candidatus Izimaplasma sp. ZiA1]|uniref:hypothetical protein n=1 Tax=Candidatus Izimoplasma sp. ZiA1 TaxID=2024899 RepID=UPI00143B9AB4